MSESLVYRVHALQRMFERGITEEDVHHVLETGEVIERYPDDRPSVSKPVGLGLERRSTVTCRGCRASGG